MSFGEEWQFGGNVMCNYYHAMLPNSPSCAFTPAASMTISSAGSLHAAGVNGLFADGHVRFISDKIDLTVWRALGTRSAGELQTDMKAWPDAITP
jgi:prepilin-type processing-associated H-X9-DG protein